MIKKLLTGFLLVLFIGYVSSLTLFYHTHTVNGKQITHSHPYSEIPDTGNHTHTSAGFTTIANLSVLLMLAVSLGFIFKVFATLISKKASSANNIEYERTLSVLSLRGPPVC